MKELGWFSIKGDSIELKLTGNKPNDYEGRIKLNPEMKTIEFYLDIARTSMKYYQEYKKNNTSLTELSDLIFNASGINIKPLIKKGEYDKFIEQSKDREELVTCYKIILQRYSEQIMYPVNEKEQELITIKTLNMIILPGNERLRLKQCMNLTTPITKNKEGTYTTRITIKNPEL